MPGRWFPDLPNFDWCLEVRRAVHVLSGEHEDDPKVVKDHFVQRVGSSRVVFLPRELFAAVSQSEEEIERFKQEAETVISERNLALMATVYRRDKKKWLVVEEPIVTASDAEIEAELAAFHELHPNEEDDD